MDHEEETINPLYSGRPAFAVRHPSWLALHRRYPGSCPPNIADCRYHRRSNPYTTQTLQITIFNLIFSGNHPLYGTFSAWHALKERIVLILSVCHSN